MRKTPSQQRSRDMVETLMQAAELEIGERGLDATTTNHVAARAGVSIGSLYQYFATKDAIVESVLQRLAARLLAAIATRLRAHPDADPRTVTRRVLKTVFDVVAADPAQRELTRHWHRLRTGPAFQALEQRMMEHCRVYLLRHHSDYPFADLPAALFVAINSLQYTVAHYMSLDAPMLTQRQVIDALADMVTAYLRAGDARGAPAPEPRKPRRAKPAATSRRGS
jgi:AcrR family transcriptional regulator